MALTHASAKPAFAGHVVFWTYQFMEHVLVRRAARTEARAEESTVPISGYNDHTEFSVHQNQQRPHRAPLWPHRRHCRRHRIHRASTRSLLQNSERHERMTSEAQLAAITVVPHPHSSKNRALQVATSTPILSCCEVHRVGATCVMPALAFALAGRMHAPP